MKGESSTPHIFPTKMESETEAGRCDGNETTAINSKEEETGVVACYASGWLSNIQAVPSLTLNPPFPEPE